MKLPDHDSIRPRGQRKPPRRAYPGMERRLTNGRRGVKESPRAVALQDDFDFSFGGRLYCFFRASFFFMRALISFLMSATGSFLFRGKRTVARAVS